ncbi:GATA transcription factor 12 [Hibiscus syriacus]|uniref:GATA transcription factor n=1 Tax=Hibiscus syriacus TaxID=106335 RepID=A0A6A2WKV6_HIBSY|nr:GATA transcription factor 12-like [Hibiscus syriacus]KAE8656585.1 GATA transcription factor 12 [Hibiscus syriacus]
MDAPEFFQASSCSSQLAPEEPASTADHFIVEDLLDFSNEDAVITEQTFDSSVAGHSTDSSTVTAVDSCNSSSFSGCEPNLVGGIGCRGFTDGHSSADLYVPCDDLAELEWLSNFVEESFSSDDLQKQQLLSGMNIRPDDALETQGFQLVLPTQINDAIDNGDYSHGNNTDNPIFNPDMSVPAKARSKRSRAAPCSWASRLLVLSSTSSYSESDIVVPVQPPPPNQPGKKPVKTTSSKKKDGGVAISDGRKCLHCATDKTPQWRTGPMGPKTLCNACGVRYKSGRLVPEYRPASSPTFVLTKHSNSHRKVLELRRQKEMLRAQQQHQQQFMQHHHQNMVFDVSNGDDYLIHQHVGPDFRQLILE